MALDGFVESVAFPPGLAGVPTGSGPSMGDLESKGHPTIATQQPKKTMAAQDRRDTLNMLFGDSLVQ